MSQPNQISPRLQQQVVRYQSLKQQFDVVRQQKAVFETATRDTDAAVNELEKAEDNVVVYKNVGGILIKSEKVKLLATLKEQKENSEMQVMVYSKKEEQLKKVLDEMGAKLQEELKSAGLSQS